MDKASARSYALKIRKTMDVDMASKKILEAIKNNKLLDKYKNIGIYYPLNYEIDLTGLLDIYKDKKFYLPITKDELAFIEYKKGDLLVDGPFKTKEPVGNVVKRDLIDCFIIPCLLISSSEKRVGYGKGYYDRYLAGYTGFKIGVCYKELSNIDIDMDEFDVKLDYLLIG